MGGCKVRNSLTFPVQACLDEWGEIRIDVIDSSWVENVSDRTRSHDFRSVRYLNQSFYTIRNFKTLKFFVIEPLFSISPNSQSNRQQLYRF